VTDPWFFNGTEYVGMKANDFSAGTALQNAQVLQHIIHIAQGDVSTPQFAATIVFPGHSVVPEPVNNETGAPDNGAWYSIACAEGDTAAVTIGFNSPLHFLGTGNCRLIFVIQDDVGAVGGDMFAINTVGTRYGTPLKTNVGGITFEDLELSYPNISTTETWTAIHTLPSLYNPAKGGAENLRLNRVILSDCPIGLWLEVALEASVTDCRIEYNGNVGTGIILGNGAASGQQGSAKEVWIAGCVFIGNEDKHPGSTALMILGCDHARVTDVRIDTFSYGIMIVPGPSSKGANAIHLSFTDVNVYVGLDASGNMGTAVKIQPQSSDQQIGQVVFTGCTFEPGAKADPGAGAILGPGVLVDATHGVIDGVRFVSCYACRWPGPGLKIMGGAQNIEVVGGMYSGNFLKLATTQPYGIYVGQANGVRINGASCIGTYTWVQLTGQSTPRAQNVGIYVDEEAQDVIIDGCDLRGNGTNGVVVNGTSGAVKGVYVRNCNVTGYASPTTAISVSGSAANLTDIEVTNCAGYNDQGVIVHAAISPPPSGTFHNTTFNYYGPIQVSVWSTNTTLRLTLQGVATQLASGTFTLGSNMSGAITYSGSPIPACLIVGM
jgi:hypothetical protein